MATMHVSEITIERDSPETDTPLAINLPDGRQLVLYASGHFTVRLPLYAGDKAAETERPAEIDIVLPVPADLSSCCNEETGDFTITAWHRH
jgi:hypothetical protein